MSSGGASEMEDVKPQADVVDRSSPSGADSRLADLCKFNLGMEDAAIEEVINLLGECKPVFSTNSSAVGGLSPEEAERYWSACSIFCVTKLRDERADMTNGERRLPLYRIVGTINISISGFFREISQFLLKAEPVLKKMYGSRWEKVNLVKEEQINFVHLKLLSSQYRSMWKKFFLSNDSNNISTDTEFVSEHLRFGWLLFLELRFHMFSRFKDLVSCINGLISIFAILILHLPVRFRRFSVLTSTHLARKSERGLDLLASLCDAFETSEADLKESLDKANTIIVDILKKKPQPASECQVETLAEIDTGGLIYFEDLMEDSSLQASLLVLEKDYDNAICKRGEIDERIFINDEGSLLGSGSLSGGPIDICRPKGNFGIMDSPAKTIVGPLSTPLSPASPASGNNLECSKVAHTPVSTTMTTAKWLRTIIAPLPSKPSKELAHFLASCDKDVTHDVTQRASIILEAIFPCRTFADRFVTGTLQNVAMMDNIWAGQRKMEALKLYYRVLEAICRAESHLLHAKNLTSLLSNERFNRCMLACSAELVLATHKTVTIMFPAVLERAGITAFDLSKVIESFVRHEDSLPRELKRHLNSLEERLLESMVWEKGSSMYNSLIVARPSLSAEINHLGLLADPMPSLDSIAMQQNMSLPSRKQDSPDNKGDIQSPKRLCTEARNVLAERNSFTSPVKDRLLTSSSVKSKLPHLQSAFATPTRPNPAGGGETCAEAGINIFFSKIIKLAAIRIRWLYEKMQLPHQILERVYCLTQQILIQRTSLFFNRHIDQLILCSFYGVSKISQLNLTFKEIINNYKKQPQWRQQVFRSVFVDWSLISDSGKMNQDHVDIITFYNRVFIPSVKPLLVEIDHGSIQKNNRLQENNINGDGQCPGSPRLSPFPTLPDMSPKKVSASHNVYVSPLRSSKMDTLLSPSSRSYYAFVGESTQAYQSPSKDLTAINNRLNCSSRKLRLNFDMVSDSLVAGSLCPQNGSSVSSSASSVMTVHPVVKSEQPDS